jgi:ribA/ribD-fused uncharacterized protein
MKNLNIAEIRSFRGENGYLSNMFSCSVTVGGLTYRCAEAAFQAQKTLNPDERAVFANFDGPQAKKYGRKVTLRSDWEQVKVGVMHDVVLAKFQQNPALAAQLIATGDADLVEGNSWGDTFWGVDNTRGGSNELGKILMAVRNTLRASANTEALNTKSCGPDMGRKESNMKNLINTYLTTKKLINDHPIYTDENHTRSLLKVDNIVYLYNNQTRKAYAYTVKGAEVVDFKPITVQKYDAVVKAYKARLDARIREDVRKARAAEDKQIVNGDVTDTASTRVAVALSSEREDSKIDFRQKDEFLGSEVDSYEQGKDLIDDDEAPVFELGYHKAYFKAYESVKGKISVGRDGQRYESAPYVKFTFTVNGADFTTRAYEKGFESFKRQMNKTHNGIFQYTRTSQALETLKGCPVDIWIKWNDVLNELQADFYDVEAYKAYKAKQAQAGNVRGGYGRPTENKATR